MTIIWNPTEEEMSPMYQGREYVIGPNTTIEVDDACGKHILTEYGRRGLTTLKFGDDKEAIGRTARRVHREFMILQVERYNATNEQRKLTGLQYLPPPKKVQEYAEILGIQLNEPYRVRDKEREEADRLRDENEQLRGELRTQSAQIGELTENVNKLMAAISAQEKATEKPAEKAKK